MWHVFGSEEFLFSVAHVDTILVVVDVVAGHVISIEAGGFVWAGQEVSIAGVEDGSGARQAYAGGRSVRFPT